jgi:hypothetical protein
MGTLKYPAQIESKLPAFYGNYIKLPFLLSKAVSIDNITSIDLRLKTVFGNLEKTTLNAKQADIFYDA